MTDLRKAAKMALEALKSCKVNDEDRNDVYATFDGIDVADAIEALRQALAQPEQKSSPTRYIVKEVTALFTPDQSLKMSDLGEWDESGKWKPFATYVGDGKPYRKVEATTTSDTATRSADSADSFCDTNCTWLDHHVDCKIAQLEQEPVAWYGISEGGELELGWDKEELKEYYAFVNPLYTAPPKREWENHTPPECKTNGEKLAFAFGWWKALEVNRKEWVGLTDEQIAEIAAVSALKTPDDIYFARLIEAMLKEKNTW